ncbi:hypothetical protein GCM10023264_13090 [Sphingomonas daechungensis]
MASVELHPDIPVNIVLLSIREPRRIRKHYERGDLIILSDVRIDADFDSIAAAEPSGGVEVRRQKFVFRKSVKGKPANRSTIWQRFFGGRLENEPEACRQIQNAISAVDTQMDRLVRKIFSRQRFIIDFTAWKFQRIVGENLHIDNLPNLNDSTQVRLFANVDNKPRRWSVGRHWRHYAERYFISAKLFEVADDAPEFNGRLNHAAFGQSHMSCDEPRHLLEFEVGEVWLINSAIVAHQVRGGDRLCSANYEYPYGQCMSRRETLPYMIREIASRHGFPPLQAKQSLRRLLPFLRSRAA